MVVATIGTGLAAMTFFRRHLYNPTVLSIERDFINWNTTFPSLTICPINKLNETALQVFLRLVIIGECKNEIIGASRDMGRIL